MSWRKTKREMHKVRKKFSLGVNLIGLVAIILIALLCLKIHSSLKPYYKVDSRVDKVKSGETFKNSGYKTMAWLKVQGTDLDMRIVRSDNANEDFPVELEDYVWSQNKDDKFHNMIRIMGHNIFNLSSTPKKSSPMFHRLEQLMAFVYYDFAKENEYIQLTIDGKDYIYKIYAVDFYSTGVASYILTKDEYTKEEIKEEIKRSKKYSIYDYDIDVNENDKLISLSTCTRFFGTEDRTLFYVYGRLLRDGEKINKYKVSKNKSYNEIEKKLKGDENNEEDNL